MITLTYGVVYQDKIRKYVINPVQGQHLRGPDALIYPTRDKLFSEMKRLADLDKVVVKMDSKVSERDSQVFVNAIKRERISLERIIKGEEILFQKEEISIN